MTPSSTPLSCATVIAVTTQGYDSLLSEASVSLSQRGTHYQTTISKAAALTASGASSDGASSKTSAAETSAASGGVAGMMADMPLLGGAIIAAAGLIVKFTTSQADLAI